MLAIAQRAWANTKKELLAKSTELKSKKSLKEKAPQSDRPHAAKKARIAPRPAKKQKKQVQEEEEGWTSLEESDEELHGKKSKNKKKQKKETLKRTHVWTDDEEEEGEEGDMLDLNALDDLPDAASASEEEEENVEVGGLNDLLSDDEEDEEMAEAGPLDDAFDGSSDEASEDMAFEAEAKALNQERAEMKAMAEAEWKDATAKPTADQFDESDIVRLPNGKELEKEKQLAPDLAAVLTRITDCTRVLNDLKNLKDPAK